MKVQTCVFKTKRNSKDKIGLAFVGNFNSGGMKFIIDENGKKQKNVWYYNFLNLPISCIDTDYR